jgi:large subunit ribosomal protein L18
MRSQKIRRKHEHKTNYKKRLGLLKSRLPRLVVRVYSRSIVGQFIEYSPEGDKVLLGINSIALKKLGWTHNCGNLPAAYLLGVMLGSLAKSKKIGKAILDIGFHPSITGTKVYAVAAGALDAGLELPVGEGMLPAEERLLGKQLGEYAKTRSGSQFSKYKTDPDFAKDVEKIKAKLLSKK